MNILSFNHSSIVKHFTDFSFFYNVCYKWYCSEHTCKHVLALLFLKDGFFDLTCEFISFATLLHVVPKISLSCTDFDLWSVKYLLKFT